MTTLIFSGVVSIAVAMLTFVLQNLIKENRKLRRENEEKQAMSERAMKDGMLCILRKHLMDEHEVWTAKGYITPHALENDLLMYKAYKALGGNGMIDHMEEDIQELPVRD